MFERQCTRVAESDPPVDRAGVSKIETTSVKLVNISKESMGQVKDKELITRHRAQNTLAQLRTVTRTVQVQWVPAHTKKQK